MKTTCPKNTPRIIHYRDYKRFDEKKFRKDLKIEIQRIEIAEYFSFHEIFLRVLNRYAPYKKRTIRGNHKPYMTKIVRKAIMRRSMLENKFYKKKSAKFKILFVKQKNYTNKLIKKAKRKYFRNLRIDNFTDNKKFWNTIKPFFTDVGHSQKITLLKDGNFCSTDQDIAETFNQFFKESVQSLDIKENKCLLTNTGEITDPVEIAFIQV